MCVRVGPVFCPGDVPFAMSIFGWVNGERRWDIASVKWKQEFREDPFPESSFSFDLQPQTETNECAVKCLRCD